MSRYRGTQDVDDGATHSVTNDVHLNGNMEGLDSTSQTSPSHRHSVGQGGQSQLIGGSWFVRLSACTAAGVAFGFAAEKAKGMNPYSGTAYKC